MELAFIWSPHCSAENRGANMKTGKRCGVCGAGAEGEGAHAHIFSEMQR
jgi:hypothetical protein